MVQGEAIVEGLALEVISETEAPVMKEGRGNSSSRGRGSSSSCGRGNSSSCGRGNNSSRGREAAVIGEGEVTVAMEGDRGDQGVLIVHGNGRQNWIHPQ